MKSNTKKIFFCLSAILLLTSCDSILGRFNPDSIPVEAYTVVLTDPVNEAKLQKTVERDDHVKTLGVRLANPDKTRTNTILVGITGAGKTTLVHALVFALKEGKVKTLRGKKVIQIHLEEINKLAGTLNFSATHYFQLFERAIASHGEENIYFIDEVQTAAKGHGSEMADQWKAFLGKYGRIIAATTEKEYEKIYFDDAVNRRIEPIVIKEANFAQTTRILEKLVASQYQDRAITKDVIKIAALSSMVANIHESIISNAVNILGDAAGYALAEDRTSIEIVDVQEATTNRGALAESEFKKLIADFKSNPTKLISQFDDIILERNQKLKEAINRVHRSRRNGA